MTAALARAAGVEKVYGRGAERTVALAGISLEVRPGEVAVLAGPSGSGKTTLLMVLAGLLRPTAGEVELCGQSIGGLPQNEVTRVRRRHVGFIFQGYNLFPGVSALDNVAEVLALRRGMPIAAARERAREALRDVGLGGRERHRPGDLSGGEKQRVAVARALCSEPSLLFGDEPTAALDRENAETVMRLIRERLGPTMGVLIVTHDRRLHRFADRLIELEDGRVMRDGRPDDPKEAADAA